MPSPAIIIMALIAAIAIAGSGFKFGVSYEKGQVADAELIKQKQFDVALKTVQDARTADREQVSKILADTADTHRKELEEHDHAAQKRIDAIRSGTGKLHVDTICPATSGGSVQPDSGHDAGVAATTGIDLPPEIGASLESVWQECDGLADDYRTLYTRAKAIAAR